jgi:4'-phosphopantetheinyl transferase
MSASEPHPGQRSPEVWFVDLTACAPSLLQAEREFPRLPADDQFGGHTERKVAHIALRVVLERHAGQVVRGMPFAVGDSGKPLLPAGLPFFSLSHCPGFALIAVDASGAVGVDLERTRSIRMPADRTRLLLAAASALAPSERELCDTGQDLLQAWVRLEAFAKADGRGIGHLLTALGIVGARTGDISASVRSVRESWPPFALRDLDVPVGHFAALATLSEALPARLPVRQFPELVGDLSPM